MSPVPSALQSRVATRLDSLEARQLRRVLRPPSGIDLSSNDYLGLAQHPSVKRRMIESIGQDGCGSTGSRLLRGHREIFERVERLFAALKGTERSLYLSSGYLANIAVLTTFAEPGDLILSDRLNHASLRDGVRLATCHHAVFPHNDTAALRELVRSARHGRGQVFVVTESVFSMDGDAAPLAEYAAICRETGAALIVDEAHAVGIYGERGSGLIEEAGISHDVFLSINPAGKALGVAGAFVAGSDWAIEYLVQRARAFVFTTAPPPCVAAALEASLTVIEQEPERRRSLRELAKSIRRSLKAAGLSIADSDCQIVPIIFGDVATTVTVAELLQGEGFDVRAIRPPSVPVGTARLRVSVNIGVARAELDRFASLLCRIDQVGLCRVAYS